MSGFMNRLLGRRPDERVDARRYGESPTAPSPEPPAATVSQTEFAQPVPQQPSSRQASGGPEASAPRDQSPSTSAPEAPRSMPPSPFGQFGENGEKVGEHISYFLARLDDVYSLRQEFAAVAEPMQNFVRSHDEAQTRLAETTALLARERAEAQAARAENLALRSAHTKLENNHAEVSNQLRLVGDAAETRGQQLRTLQIAHDDVAARLDWATRQLASEAQTSRDQADAHRVMADDLGRVEQELAHERARSLELKDLYDTANAEVRRMQTQLERLTPNLAAAKRRIHDLENDASAAAATLGVIELKLAGEQENRRAADAMRAQEKTQYETETSALMLQVEALEGRQQVTTRLFEQSRALLNEKIDELRVADRANKDLLAEKTALERRHASAQDEVRRLLDQGADLGTRHGDLQERCSMLTNALAAKDAHIEQLQVRAEAAKVQLDDAIVRHEEERAAIDSSNRRLVEEVQSERAERALVQGALSIARGSREKLLAQIEDLKRNRIGPMHEPAAETREPPRDPEGGGNITRFRPPEPQGEGA